MSRVEATQRTIARTARRPWLDLEGRFPYLMIGPTVLAMLLLLVGPLLYSLFLSMQAWVGGVPGDLIGLGNYQSLLGKSQFWNSLQLTAIYTAATVTLQFVLGFGLALLLRRATWFSGIFRSAFILPMMVTPVVSGLLWRLMLDPTNGIVNFFVGRPILWTGDSFWAMVAVILVGVWQQTPFVIVLLLAALLTLPEEPFEAAIIDGASRWQVFRYLTLPLLTPTILVVLLIRTIFELRTFDHIWILTTGGPANGTALLSILAYQYGFMSFDLGTGAATAWLMLLLTVAICSLYVAVLYRNVEGN